MTQEQLRNLNNIVSAYGDDPQVDVCIEECAELQKALLKRRREVHKGFPDPEKVKAAKDAIIDELADVSIMVEQMKIIYGYEAVEDRINFKIERQMDRLRNRGCENVEK